MRELDETPGRSLAPGTAAGGTPRRSCPRGGGRGTGGWLAAGQEPV